MVVGFSIKFTDHSLSLHYIVVKETKYYTGKVSLHILATGGWREWKDLNLRLLD